MAAVGGSIFVGFGLGPGLKNDLWQWQPGGSWSQVTTTNTPTAVAYPAAGHIGTTLYKIGGETGNTAGDDVLWSIDLSSIAGSAPGGVSGDPHFQSFSGGSFDISGSPGKMYNLISGPWGQVNAQFIGHQVDQHVSNITFLGEIAIVLGRNASVVRYNPRSDEFTWEQPPSLPKSIIQAVTVLNCDGQDYPASKTTRIATIQLPGLRLTFSRKWQPKIAGFGVTLRASLTRTPHGAPGAHCSSPLHGLLGQTSAWTEPVTPGAKGEAIIEGMIEDYEVPSLMSCGTRFSVCQHA